jgi:competence protein ComEC
VKRPLVAIAVAYVAGLLIGVAETLPHPLFAPTLAVLFLLLAVPLRRRRFYSGLLLCLAFVMTGAGYWHARESLADRRPLSPELSLAAEQGAQVVLQGRVTCPSLPLSGRDYGAFHLDVSHCIEDGIAVPMTGRVVVRGEFGAVPFTGDVARAEGRLNPALARVNPGLGNSEDYLRQRDVDLALAVRESDAVSVVAAGPGWLPQRWIERLRLAEAALLKRVVPKEAYPFLVAVWLGERSGIGEEAYQGFVRTGTAHVLAVSGIHVGLVGLSLLTLMQALTRRKSVYVPVTILAVFLFALLAGGRVSSLRAAVMLSMYLLSDALDRERDVPTTLAAAGLLFLLVSPRLVLDGGFQLSFLSVASLLLFTEPLAEAIRWGKPGLRQALAVPVAVQILPLPIALRLFFVLPLIAPVVNLVVVPLLGIILWLAFMTCVTGFLFEPVAMLFGHALAPAVYVVEWLAEWGARLPFAYVRVGPPSLAALLLYGIAAGLAWWAATLPKRTPLTGLPAMAGLVAALLLWQPPVLPPEMVFLDVAHGDATFARSPEGRTLLVDGGDHSEYVDYGGKVVAPFLLARYVKELDYAVATHADRDHMAGLIRVIEEIPVATLVLGPRPSGSPLEERLLEACRQRGVAVRRVARGDVLDLGGMRAEVIHPPADWSGGDNDGSVVLRVAWEGVRVLLPGDVEEPAEAGLARQDVAADVLKVAHHGSRTSSTAAFLAAVNARLAVISTGGMVGREAVDPAILDRLEARAMPIFRTDHDGAVTLRVVDGQIVAICERQHRGYVRQR